MCKSLFFAMSLISRNQPTALTPFATDPTALSPFATDPFFARSPFADQFAVQPWSNVPTDENFMIPVNVSETPDRYKLTVQVPGLAI